MYRLMYTYEICKMECINSRCGAAAAAAARVHLCGVFASVRDDSAPERKARSASRGKTRTTTIIYRQQKPLCRKAERLSIDWSTHWGSLGGTGHTPTPIATHSTRCQDEEINYITLSTQITLLGASADRGGR